VALPEEGEAGEDHKSARLAAPSIEEEQAGAHGRRLVLVLRTDGNLSALSRISGG